MRGGGIGALPIRHGDLIDAPTAQEAGHSDHRQAGFPQLHVERGRSTAGSEDQAAHALGSKYLQATHLLIGILIVIGQKQRVVGLSEDVLNPADDAGEKGILDVWNQDPYRTTGTHPEVAGGAVGSVG